MPEVVDIKRFIPVDEYTYGYVDHHVPMSLLADKNDIITCPNCSRETSICDIDTIIRKHKEVKKDKEEENESPFARFETYK